MNANEEEADRKAILALVDRWRAAKKARDIQALLELVADDVVFLPSRLPPIKGKGEVEKLYRTFLQQYHEIGQHGVSEEVCIAGDWAFMWGSDELRLVPESGGAEIQMRGKGLSILRRQADRSWRFWRGINNMTRTA